MTSHAILSPRAMGPSSGVVPSASDAARWINGANLPVDGGLEASIDAEVLGV